MERLVGAGRGGGYGRGSWGERGEVGGKRGWGQRVGGRELGGGAAQKLPGERFLESRPDFGG